jgi:hypothetical protein
MPSSLRQQGTFLELSLTALQPAAAWFFIFIVCLFSPRRGEKRHTAKVLFSFYACFIFARYEKK